MAIRQEASSWTPREEVAEERALKKATGEMGLLLELEMVLQHKMAHQELEPLMLLYQVLVEQEQEQPTTEMVRTALMEADLQEADT